MDTLRIGLKAGALGFGTIAIIGIVEFLGILLEAGIGIFLISGFLFGMLSCYFYLRQSDDVKLGRLIAAGTVAGLMIGLASTLIPFFRSVEYWFVAGRLGNTEALLSGLRESHFDFNNIFGSVIMGAVGATTGTLLSKPRQKLVLSYIDPNIKFGHDNRWWRWIVSLCIFGLMVIFILGGVHNYFFGEEGYQPISKTDLISSLGLIGFILGSIPISMFYFASYLRSKAITRADHLLFRWWFLFGVSLSIVWLFTFLFFTFWMSASYAAG